MIFSHQNVLKTVALQPIEFKKEEQVKIDLGIGKNPYKTRDSFGGRKA